MTFNKEDLTGDYGTDERKWMEYQAPLRHTAYFDENATPEEKAEADRLLRESIEVITSVHPPLTGTFRYTQEDVEEAKRHGF